MALLLSLLQLVKVVFQIVKKNFARGIGKKKIRDKNTPKNWKTLKIYWKVVEGFHKIALEAESAKEKQHDLFKKLKMSLKYQYPWLTKYKENWKLWYFFSIKWIIGAYFFTWPYPITKILSQLPTLLLKQFMNTFFHFYLKLNASFDTFFTFLQVSFRVFHEELH